MKSLLSLSFLPFWTEFSREIWFCFELWFQLKSNCGLQRINEHNMHCNAFLQTVFEEKDVSCLYVVCLSFISSLIVLFHWIGIGNRSDWWCVAWKLMNKTYWMCWSWAYVGRFLTGNFSCRSCCSSFFFATSNQINRNKDALPYWSNVSVQTHVSTWKQPGKFPSISLSFLEESRTYCIQMNEQVELLHIRRMSVIDYSLYFVESTEIHFQD